MSEPSKWGARIATYLTILFAYPFIRGVSYHFGFGFSTRECLMLSAVSIVAIVLISWRDGHWG